MDRFSGRCQPQATSGGDGCSGLWAPASTPCTPSSTHYGDMILPQPGARTDLVIRRARCCRLDWLREHAATDLSSKLWQLIVQLTAGWACEERVLELSLRVPLRAPLRASFPLPPSPSCTSVCWFFLTSSSPCMVVVLANI